MTAQWLHFNTPTAGMPWTGAKWLHKGCSPKTVVQLHNYLLNKTAILQRPTQSQENIPESEYRKVKIVFIAFLWQLANKHVRMVSVHKSLQYMQCPKMLWVWHVWTAIYLSLMAVYKFRTSKYKHQTVIPVTPPCQMPVHKLQWSLSTVDEQA